MSEDWNSLRLIEWTTSYFEKVGVPNSRLDAELLLAHVLQVKRIGLYTDHEKRIGEKELARFKTLIQRRVKREPLQQILGETEFYGLKFKVTPDVLIPRPETELLVEETVRILDPPSPPLTKRGPGGFSVLDIGTGSGCIAITLAKHFSNATIVATDISKEALEIARENAKRHEVSIEFILADIAPWKRFTAEGRTFDLIVSNPPYIPNGEFLNLQPEVRDFEPRKALEGGLDGLAAIQRILTEAPPFLQSGGSLLLEIGEDQGDSLRKLFEDIGSTIEFTTIKKDLAGHDRIVIARKLSTD